MTAWWEQQGSKLRLLGPQPSALPLHLAPMVAMTGTDPVASAFSVQRSVRLSYIAVVAGAGFEPASSGI